MKNVMNELVLKATNAGLDYMERAIFLQVSEKEYLCVDLVSVWENYPIYRVGGTVTKHLDEMFVDGYVPLPYNYDITKSEWYTASPYTAQFLLDHLVK